MIENTQKTPTPASDALTLGGRFHYWEGQSGERYIFSVYKAGTCPPLPGAVYVIAKRSHDGQRYPLAIGRFPAIWEAASRDASKLLKMTGGDEVHVHLLAEGDAAAEEVVRTLKPTLGSVVRLRVTQERPEPPTGFAEKQTDLFGLQDLEQAA